MTAFGKTILGKAFSKGAALASVVASPNPIQAAAAALKGGVAKDKKEAVNTSKEIQTQSRSMQSGARNAGSESQTGGGFMDKLKANKTLLGITLPLWIWGAAVVVILFLVWKFVFKAKKRNAGRARTSAARTAKARMARVRSFRRKK